MIDSTETNAERIERERRVEATLARLQHDEKNRRTLREAQRRQAVANVEFIRAGGEGGGGGD